jgi:predicted transposase YbfD/YdcC
MQCRTAILIPGKRGDSDWGDLLCERQTCFDRGAPGRAVLDEFDDGHGCLVRRRIFVSVEAAGLEALRCWPGLHAVLAVETIRSVNGTAKTMAELRYFLTSCHDAPEVLAKAIRKPWTIENNLHWVLDVTFREDESRVRNRRAVRNLAILRKIAVNRISRDRSSKTSKRGRRKQAAWNDTYMLRLLRGYPSVRDEFHALP